MSLKQAIDYLQHIADNTENAGYSKALAVALSAMREKERTESANAIYRSALDTFGLQKQTIKLFEEIGEFSDAFCKCLEGCDKVSHVAEEMADVHNMLDQFAVYLKCEDEVERQKRYKLRRLEQKVDEVQGDGNEADN